MSAGMDKPVMLTRRLDVRLRVSDPEIIEALEAIEDESDRQRHAEAALRIGVLALSRAGRTLDAGQIERAGEAVVSDLREALQQHSRAVTDHVSSTLKTYLDPSDGHLPQRLQRLVADGGELDRLLRDRISGDHSQLAQTMASHVGERSPLFQMLDPQRKEGLSSSIAREVGEALQQQRQALLQQFSLDFPESALSRLRGEITTSNGELQQALCDDVEKLKVQFSLDAQDSVMSRLVDRLEATRAGMIAQLSLDNDTSALTRLRRELNDTLAQIQTSQSGFQTEVSATLAALSARREEAAKGTAHGMVFEDALGAALQRIADGRGDVLQATGSVAGAVSRAKVGDFVITAGPEKRAAGRRVVVEAKQSSKYTDQKALTEIDAARVNRRAEVGLFVFSARSVNGLVPVRRFGQDVIAVWDAESAHDDVVLEVAYSLVMALLTQRSATNADAGLQLDKLDRAIDRVEQQLESVKQVRSSADTADRALTKIQKAADKMDEALRKDVAELEELAQLVRQAVEGSAS